MSDGSKLIKDLNHVPDIIAALGLSIAEAQRRFNLDYLQAVERLMVVAQSMLGSKPAAAAGGTATPNVPDADVDPFRANVVALLTALVPSRYQFTETTLTVRLDLAQSLDISGGGGISAGVGAVAVNASFAVGYSQDYRAAAECQTVLQAMPADMGLFKSLLERAKELHKGDTLALPAGSQLDKDVAAQAASIFERMTGKPPAALT